ncbi:MAG: BadF/BadG/BcrA/BcrD ATPase family protein, partial [Desulfobacterales bacterium]
MITAGIDIGSITAKAALIITGQLAGTCLKFTGYNVGKAARAVLDELLEETGIRREDVGFVISTGYGRNGVDFADRSVTEITCHGAGAHFIDPEIRFVIDVGGQDSKVIRISDMADIILVIHFSY